MSELLDKQWEFSQSLASLIRQAYLYGFRVQMGEVYRTPLQAAANAASGSGIANSVHCDHLAVDINLFTPDGTYITDDTGHKLLGPWWKLLGPDYRWGGNFDRRDFNHYSITPDGERA